MLKKIGKFILLKRLNFVNSEINRVSAELRKIDDTIEEITSTNGAKMAVMPSSSYSRFMQLVEIRKSTAILKSLLESKKSYLISDLK